MTASSASFPQPRREALRQQLLVARSHGDQLAIKRIERQWVHRYGVDTLLELTGDPVAADAQSDDLAEAGAPEDLAFALSADLVSGRQEGIVGVAMEAEPARIDVARDLSADPRGEAGAAASRLSNVSPVALEQVPPPPVPRIHRLRRWLPKAADELRKAS